MARRKKVRHSEAYDARDRLDNQLEATRAAAQKLLDDAEAAFQAGLDELAQVCPHSFKDGVCSLCLSVDVKGLRGANLSRVEVVAREMFKGDPS